MADMIEIDDHLINPDFIVSVKCDHDAQRVRVHLSDGREISARAEYRGTISDRFHKIRQAIANAKAIAL